MQGPLALAWFSSKLTAPSCREVPARFAAVPFLPAPRLDAKMCSMGIFLAVNGLVKHG